MSGADGAARLLMLAVVAGEKRLPFVLEQPDLVLFLFSWQGKQQRSKRQTRRSTR